MINRKTEKIKINKKIWRIQGLLPIDFVGHNFFPFSYFIFKDRKSPKTIKRDWKLKTKKVREEDAVKENIIKIGVVSPRNVTVDPEKDELTYNILLGSIYALTYDLTLIEKYFTPQKEIHREFAENIYFLSQKMNTEPYALYTDISKELPSLHNPERWDFNLFVIQAGLEREQMEYDEAINKAKAEK